MRKFLASKSFLSFIFTLAVILLLIFFNSRGWLAVPKNLVAQVFSPLLKSFNWVGHSFAASANILFTLKDLVSENNNLRQANQQLAQENSDLKELARENILLRERLNLGPAENYQFILASVIGYNEQLGKYFLINKGTADGVEVGLAAVTANNFLVGKVTGASSHSAKITLIIDSNSAVNALSQDTRVSGIVRGVHGLSLDLEMIPIDKKINVGENIITSGRDDKIPVGLIIGQVGEVTKKESDIFQQATIQLAVDFAGLESVFVVK